MTGTTWRKTIDAPTLFDGDLLDLITQYERDIAIFGHTGRVRCAACGDRRMPTEHVVARLEELRARAFIHVEGDPTDRPKAIALDDLARHEAAIERALR